MKKIRITVIILSAFILIFTLAGCNKSYFFRKVDFGMTRDEVKKAESSLGEPASVLNNSFLYREIVYLDTGGDVIYSFDENDQLNGIIYYAYEQYYTDDVYARVLSELKNKHEGYTPFEQENTDANIESWTIKNKDISVKLEYKTGQYLVIRYTLDK